MSFNTDSSMLHAKGNSIENFTNSLREVYPSVKFFYFIVYTPWVASVEQRVGKKRDRGFHSLTHFGERKWAFEKSLMLQIVSGRESKEVAENLLMHDEQAEDSRIVQVASENLEEWLRLAKKRVKSTETIGLTSMCESFDGVRAHIPMMDFSCPPSSENQTFVRHALQEIGIANGIIVNSGRSFHAYGFKVLTVTEWTKFMGQCLLLSPYTDSRYIGHRLIADRCILRIWTSEDKPELPWIVDKF